MQMVKISTFEVTFSNLKIVDVNVRGRFVQRQTSPDSVYYFGWFISRHAQRKEEVDKIKVCSARSKLSYYDELTGHIKVYCYYEEYDKAKAVALHAKQVTQGMQKYSSTCTRRRR
jgi:hypothetical protein